MSNSAENQYLREVTSGIQHSGTTTITPKASLVSTHLTERHGYKTSTKMWWFHGDRPRPLITSQEQQGPPLTVQGGQREAGEYHAAPQEGSRDDTAGGRGGDNSEAHTHTHTVQGAGHVSSNSSSSRHLGLSSSTASKRGPRL